MDQAHLRNSKVMEMDEGGETVTLLNSAEPRPTRKRKRNSYPGGTKEEGIPHLNADSKGDSDMEMRGETKHDGDTMDTQEDLPMHKLYEVRRSPGKGMGIFAIRDIQRGTRIICEKPLIRQPGLNSLDVLIPFLKLSDPDRATFLSLHCHPGAINAGKEKLVRLGAKEFPTDEQLKIMAIANTNAFATEEGWVICPETSRINHSCLPNVHHCWNNFLGAETVHAVRDILEGEEILTTYIDIREDFFRRQERLDKYGFQCTCPCCDLSTSFGQASEKRRKRLLQIDREWSHIRNAAQALTVVLKSIDLLKEEGIYNTELTRAYREAAMENADLGQLEDACEWAEKALENTASCSGIDYHMYEEDEKRLEDFVARRDANES